MAILVYTENWDGKFKKLSYELISYANELAKSLNTECMALTIGQTEEGELESLAKYGAKKVYKIVDEKYKDFNSQSYSSAVAEFMQQHNVDIAVFSNNYTGRSLAPRISVKLSAGLASGVTDLPKSTDPFVVKRKVYSGKAYADMEIKSEKKLLSLNQNAFKIIEDPVDVVIEDFVPTSNENDFVIESKEVNKIKGKVPLTDAEIIVSGGRGMKGPEKWGILEELAEELNAGTACSRPVSDLEWRSHDEHVGQTGKVVSPNLYIAVGISGAIQHIAGVNSSKFIVAINTDHEAPIFEAADYGIIGDAFEVVPKLTQALKSFKERK